MKIPLVLISGLLSNESLWLHQARHLEDIASLQIISPAQDTPKKMIQSILHQAPSKFALVGHSMGGWLSLEIMRAAPFRVTQLCLVNTTARMDSEAKTIKRRSLIQRAEQGQFSKIVDEIVEAFVFNPLVKTEIKRMFLDVGKEAFIHQEKAMIARTESLSILPTIKCPTLVIHSLQDKNFSLEEHKELADLIPNAKLALIENSGHMSPIEQPEAVTTLLRSWLT